MPRPVRTIPLKRLLALKNYPPDVMVLFAEGYGLTRFLVARRDHQTFLRFVRTGMDKGWDKAVKEHYGLAGVEELEAVWLAPLRRKAPAAPQEAETDSRAPTPKGPAPITALAQVTREDKIAVSRPVRCVRPVTQKFSREGQEFLHPVTAYVHDTVMAQVLHPLAEVRAFDLMGQPIETQQLHKLLARETTVVVSADGKNVDPFYLRVMKEGTIVLVLPPPPAPPRPEPPPVTLPAVSEPRAPGGR